MAKTRRRIDGSTNLSSKQASQSKCGASSSTGAPTCTLNMTSPLSRWNFSTDGLPWPRWFVNLLGSAYESGLFLWCFLMIPVCKPTAWLARTWLTTCRSFMIQLEPHCIWTKLSHPLRARETAHDSLMSPSTNTRLSILLFAESTDRDSDNYGVVATALSVIFTTTAPQENLFISVTHTKLHFQCKSSIGNATKGLFEVHGNC